MAGWIALLGLAWLLAAVQHTLLGGVAIAPDLPIALLAYIAIDGPAGGLLLRAAAIGLIHDAIDPGALWFHTAVGIGLGAIALALRRLLLHRQAAAWGLAGTGAGAIALLADAAAAGWGDAGAGRLAASALLTGLAAMALGAALTPLPARLHPAGRDGGRGAP